MLLNGAHKCLQDNEAVQTTVKDNPGIGSEEAEELIYDKLEPRLRSEIIDRYQSFLAISKAMKKDPFHKKITATAKRIRDEDEFDEDEVLDMPLKRRYLMENLIHQPIS